ncbi:MAG: NUDIX hydrolase [Chloroflexi bacterium]|nr:NUDIX hydrolase [Chloroflexota bacterium]
MTIGKIRPIAICIIWYEGKILVAEGYDAIKHEIFYRPLGGGIQFGETGKDTIVRELKEEIGADVTDLHYLGTFENLFTLNGEPGHEIVLVYRGTLDDPSNFAYPRFLGKEDNDQPFYAAWISLDDFIQGKAILYPEGLVKLLNSHLI